MTIYSNKNPIAGRSITYIPHLQINSVENGLVLPLKPSKNPSFMLGGVCDEDGNLVAGFNRNSSSVSSSNPGWAGICGTYDHSGETIEFVGESVIFGGVLMWHFGHFLLECMSRLWYVVENPQDTRKIVL